MDASLHDVIAFLFHSSIFFGLVTNGINKTANMLDVPPSKTA